MSNHSAARVGGSGDGDNRTLGRPKFQSNHHHQHTNTQFLPHNAMHKHSTTALASVSPSITDVCCIQMDKDITLFSWPDTNIVVFQSASAVTEFQGE